MLSQDVIARYEYLQHLRRNSCLTAEETTELLDICSGMLDFFLDENKEVLIRLKNR